MIDWAIPGVYSELLAILYVHSNEFLHIYWLLCFKSTLKSPPKKSQHILNWLCQYNWILLSLDFSSISVTSEVISIGKFVFQASWTCKIFQENELSFQSSETGVVYPFLLFIERWLARRVIPAPGTSMTRTDFPESWHMVMCWNAHKGWVTPTLSSFSFSFLSGKVCVCPPF